MSASDQQSNEGTPIAERNCGEGDVGDPPVAPSFYEIAPAALLIASHEGEVLQANRRASELLSYKNSRLIGVFLHELMLSNCREPLNIFLARVSESAGIETCEIQMTDGAGQVVDVLIQGRSAHLKSTPVVVLSLSDFSAWRHVDPQAILVKERLRHSQKMEAIGQLTASITHDFNNILTIISGYNRVLLNEIKRPALRTHLQKIASAAEHASELVAKMLAFGRSHGPEPRVVDLNAHIRKFEDLFTSIVGDGIQWSLDLASEPLDIRVNPNQIDQVLMNLVINARDAMGGRGKLSMSTRRQYVCIDDPDELAHLMPGVFAILRICDDGCGMLPETATRAFEPFYSTKSVENGTGLGLSTCRSIMRDHGGAIVLEIGLGEGSCFELYFPLVDTPDAGVVENPTATTGVYEDTILVVDENRQVSELIVHVLQAQGFQVTDTFASAEAADSLYSFDQYALAVIDLGLPRPQVKELVNWMQQRQPDIKFLFLCGHGHSRASELPARSYMLRKPFTPQDLLAAVCAFLDAP